MPISTIIILTIAYLVGSVSSAILICKLQQLPDPRSQGSGNAGATNVLRFADKKVAALVLAGDFFKGLLMVLIAKLCGFDRFTLGMVAVLTVLGHIFPIFFAFKGGKGVATACGSIMALSWPLGIALISTWLAIALVSRYSSLAAIVCALLAPIFALLLNAASYFFPLLLMTALLLWRHLDNLRRLSEGTESKIGETS